MNDRTERRMPQFPIELLNSPRPACMMRLAQCERDIRAGVDNAVAEINAAYLEILHALHVHITEAVALIDARKTSDARAKLDTAVRVLDGIDFSLLAPAENK